MQRATWILPIAAILFVAALFALRSAGATEDPTVYGALAAVLIPILFGAIFAAVHHAEVIAHRLGEPYGTLVLTVAVTIIELALIVSIMLATEGGNATLARDTVFAVVMIVCNGLVGACIVWGGLRHREQSFRVTGASAYLTVLAPMSVLTMVLPAYTQSAEGLSYTPLQLGFASVATLALYGVFLYIQTVRHRDYFTVLRQSVDTPDEHTPSRRAVALSAAFLMVSLTAVILLSKEFAGVLDGGLSRLGAPAAVTGVVLALLILLLEAIAALQAARRDQLQKSLNLALGSSLATIGLTIPAVAVVSLLLGKDLTMGLEDKDSILLLLTIVVSTLTFGTGRTNILYGFVHLVIFATFVFLVFAP